MPDDPPPKTGPETADRDVQVTREEALRLLGRRAFSRGELEARLESRGYTAGAIACVLGELTDKGWLDDEAYAEDVSRHLLERSPMPAAILAERLRARLIDFETAERVADAAVEGIDMVEAAAALGRRRLATMRRIDPPVATRRVAGALLRRGFDEETVAAALRQLGLPTEEDSSG